MIYAAITVSKLKSRINKNVYCFGAGKAFDSFVSEFAEFKLEDDIKAIADNNCDIAGASGKMVNGIYIPIITPKQMLDDMEDGDCILLTTAAYGEIIQQLEPIRKLKYTKCYVYSLLRSEQYDYDRLYVPIPRELSTCKERLIPKTIHYCWFGDQKIPALYRKWMESWKKYCPDYEIVEWNEHNYDVHKNRYISQAYEMKKWAFVSDYARIDILNEYGGVYLDTDVELIKNIDELLMNHGFCGFETNKYVNYGLGFGTQKHNRILRELKDYYDHADFLLKDGTLNMTTCPQIQTKIMKKHGLKCSGEFQVVDNMVVYPSRILCGMSPHSFRVERSFSHTYAIHHFEGSWVEDKSLKNILVSNIKKWSSSRDYVYLDI